MSWFIDCCKQNWDVIISLFKPSQDFVSFLYQLVVVAFKSRMVAIKKRLLLVCVSKVA